MSKIVDRTLDFIELFARERKPLSLSEISRLLDIPLIGLWAWLRRPERYCWNHQTVPQPNLGGRLVWYPAGRIVGGSSAIKVR